METIQMLGSLGEFVGSIAVVMTLIFLVFQVRANTHSMDEGRRLAMSEAYQSRAQMLQEEQFRIMDSPYLVGISQKLQEGSLDSLTSEERARLQSLQTSIIARVDNVYYQYQQGFLDEEFYEHQFRVGVANFAPQWWAFIDPRLLRPSFRLEVDRILAESEENEQ